MIGSRARRHTGRSGRAAALGIALGLGAAGAASAAADAARLAVTHRSGGSELRFSDPRGSVVILRATQGAISGERLIELDGAELRVVLWDERQEAAEERYMAASRDGGASWSEPRRIDLSLRLRNLGEEAAARAESLFPPELLAAPESRLWVVAFELPSLSPLRRRLEALGVVILASLPEHAHLARMDAASAERARAEPFVRSVTPYHPGYRLEPELLEALGGEAELAQAEARYLIQTFTPGLEEKSLLAAEIAALGGSARPLQAGGRLLEASLDPAALRALVHSEHLLWIERWRAPEDDMDIVRGVSGADSIEFVAGFDGSGVSGEVLDSGLMLEHPDFTGVSYHGAIPGASNHGTATYGIVFGNGARDGEGEAAGTGLLPSGTGWAADYRYLVDRYAHTSELVSEPIGAVFQSNSWGSGRTLFYSALSAELDDIAWLYDLPIFQSQSNAGDQYSRPQAWSKNVVSIGGVRHWDNSDPSDDCWCATASIGPAEDGRVKPDLVHFYDLVHTTDREPDGYAAGLYAEFGGTSAATPIVAGLSGLVAEMWAADVFGTRAPGLSVFEARPRLATTKALLINAAAQYPFEGPGADMGRAHQGWGLPNVRNLYDRAGLTQVIDGTRPLAELTFDSFLADVAEGQAELKVTLVYTDRAGNPAASVSRVNDLSLKVTAPDGTPYWGNNGLHDGVWSLPGGSPDARDTVENVFLEAPAAGAWKIEVFADEVVEDQHLATPTPDQDYALVVYGGRSLSDCRGASEPPADLVALPDGDNRISLSWSGTASPVTVLRAEGGCGAPFEVVASSVDGSGHYLDAAVSGRILYGYAVRAGGACESRESACVEALTSGSCELAPVFGGVASVAGSGEGVCGIALAWEGALGRCGGPLRYSVYRSADASFKPGPGNRIAACLDAASFVDRSGVVDGRAYGYVVRAEDLGAVGQGPCGGIEEGNLHRLSGEPRLLAAWDFETDVAPWLRVSGSPAAATGDFVVGDPIGTFEDGQEAQPEEDASPAGTRCLYTAPNPVGVASVSDVDGGEVVALSPLVDASGYDSLQLSYSRWHFNRDVAEDTGDYFAFDVSGDGGSTWRNVELLGSEVNANTWTERSFELDGVIPLSSRLRLRVRSADGPAATNTIESAIDDVRLERRSACVTEGGLPGVIGAPLLAVKSATGGLSLSWGADCGAASRYGIYRGELALGFASLLPLSGACDVAALSYDLGSSGASEFFMVAPNDGAEEGSLGRLATGRRHPPGAACHPEAAALDACAP